ncbi:MAG: branched-chain amino acid ABC transporter permease, partial [Pseudomonadota bacterium]
MLKSNLSKTVLFLAVVALLCSFPFWIKNQYLIHILILMFLNIVYAMGVSMIYKSGSLTFGHAAYAGIGA